MALAWLGLLKSAIWMSVMDVDLDNICYKYNSYLGNKYSG